MKETHSEGSAEKKEQTPPSEVPPEPTLYDIHQKIQENMHPAGWILPTLRVGPPNSFLGINGWVLPPLKIKSE